jgi:sigma-B regulation protein RsbU (phosphoserine phosphatase)
LNTFLEVRTRAPNVPIVVLTGGKDEVLALEAVKQGAQDNLNKNYLDTAVLERALRYAIERFSLQKAEQRLRAAKEELRVASEIHQRLLPQSAPRIAGLDIAGRCQPAVSAGGDYFDYIPMPDGSLGVLLADVSGHGFAPALIMAGTRRLLRTLASTHTNLAEILQLANRAIAEDTEQVRFVTMFMAAIEPATRRMNYVGAGHQAYLLDGSGGVRVLESTALPLGLPENSAIQCGNSVVLEPGQILLVLSDGFDEAQSPDGGLFGVKRVLNLVATSRQRPAEEIVNLLFREVLHFCQRPSANDDITAVVVKAV